MFTLAGLFGWWFAKLPHINLALVPCMAHPGEP